VTRLELTCVAAAAAVGAVVFTAAGLLCLAVHGDGCCDLPGDGDDVPSLGWWEL
jgi:hypothetical protein